MAADPDVGLRVMAFELWEGSELAAASFGCVRCIRMCILKDIITKTEFLGILRVVLCAYGVGIVGACL